jgi:hypothetical protein
VLPNVQRFRHSFDTENAAAQREREFWKSLSMPELPRQIFDNFVNQETQQQATICHRSFSSSVRPSIHVLCHFALGSNGLETALHDWGASDVRLKFSEGMLDEDRRDKAQSGLADDHKPNDGYRPSCRGRPSCCRIVHRNTAK